jgi:hypothetical protein
MVKRGGFDDVRPDVDATLLLVADDTHVGIAKLDDAFLL